MSDILLATLHERSGRNQTATPGNKHMGNTAKVLRRAVRFNKLLTAVLLSVVVIAVVSTAMIGHEARKRDRTVAIAEVAELISDRITRQVSAWLVLPSAGGDYFEVVGTPDPVQMLEFEQRLQTKFPALQLTSFVGRVTDGERLRHVSQMRMLGFTDYEIRDLTPDLQLVKSPTRQEYYPVDVPGLEGWDISSDPQFGTIMHALLENNQPVARVLTHPLGTLSGSGMVVFYPVFEAQDLPETGAARQPEIAGLFIVSLDPEIVVDRAIIGLEDQVAIELLIGPVIETAPAVDPLYKSTRFDALAGRIQEELIPVTGEVWILRVKGEQGLQGSWPSWMLLTISTVVGAATLVLGAVLLFLAQQRKDVIEISRQLRELGEVKDRFLSTVSHELKNPLTSIQAFADVLVRNRLGHLDERELKQLKIISRNSTQLDFLINDLLDVSRYHAGTIDLNIEDFGVQEFISEVQDEFEPILTAKHQSLTVTMGFGDMCLSADRHRVGQVLSNLISNASKYSDPGSTVWLSVSAVDDQLQISVRDEGIGIAPEDLVQVGTPFFRADSERSRIVGGTGLGIHVTKSIVELHGGSFELMSEPGRGTSVVLRLPGAHELQPLDAEPVANLHQLSNQVHKTQEKTRNTADHRQVQRTLAVPVKKPEPSRTGTL